MDKKESECKITNFIQKLPPPSVSIERWRAHDGMSKSVYEVYAPNPCNSDYEKDPYVINQDLMDKEMEEWRLLSKRLPELTHMGSSHM